MQNFNNQNTETKYLFLQRVVLTCCILCLFSWHVSAQSCPPNIDFEFGDFTGWQCYTGTFNTAGIVTVGLPVQPIPGRHDMLSSVPGDGLDTYGRFPKNCPNGSGHSIKLGNEQSGGTADRVSYTFTIPANRINSI